MQGILVTYLTQYNAYTIVRTGFVSDDDIKTVRDAGFDDQKIVEIIGTIVMINFANFVSNVGQQELDLPKVSL